MVHAVKAEDLVRFQKWVTQGALRAGMVFFHKLACL